MRKSLLITLVLLLGSSIGLFSQTSNSLRVTPIHHIQGDRPESSLVSKKVAAIGIVTADFSGKDRLNGFFLQELSEDDDPETSEGIFIYDPQQLFKGQPGDVVQVIGEVTEYKSNNSSLTQISKVTSISVLAEKQKLPKPKIVTLPVDNWEKYEGMLVKVTAPSGSLYVTELYQLGRYGQLTLSISDELNQPSTDGRLDQFTQFNKPDIEGYKAYINYSKQKTIIIDDGSGIQNPAIIPYGRDGSPFNMFHAIRAGDITKEVIGIVDERFGDYRIQPTETIRFKPKNKRPAKPKGIPFYSNLIIASFNVLNYFNGDGQGGGFPAERGARNINEFERQQVKTINVLLQSKADIISLMEMENDGFGEYSAIVGLCEALNKATDYEKVFRPVVLENPGTDAITSAIIYDERKVEPVGKAVGIPDKYGHGSFDVALRKPIIQTFRHIKTGEEFTIVSIHFKSKGYLSPGEGNKDKVDGQGQNNEVRWQQVRDLLWWLDTNPTNALNDSYLLMGDFNSYYMEDPLTYLTENGFTNLLPPKSYSFVYNGFWGALDHAFAKGKIKDRVTKAVKWHINADEAPILDYSIQYKTKEQAETFFDDSVFRSSDHDPIIIGLRLRKVKE